jgi:regulator of protease activity HflC (stomatin/prohibitin superfamily)
MDNTSSLFSTDIANSSEASAVFGQSPGLLVAIPGRGWAPYLIIPEGFYGLVTSSGAEICTETGSPVWPSGFISAGPFTRISHLVTKAYCVFNVPVKGCKTADNVTVTIDCSIVFRIMGDSSKGEDPELVRTFVHDCTPAGLEQQLKDAMAEEIRTLARSMKHTEVYTARSGPPPPSAESAEDSKGGGGGSAAAEARSVNQEEAVQLRGLDVTNEMQRRLNEQFQSQGVEIQDIMIQNISLPQEIEQGMSNKTLVRSKQEYEVMEQTFEMQSIRLKNDEDKLKLDYKEKEEIAKVEGGRDVQAARDALSERKAERDKALADFKQGTVTEERKIKAEMKEITTKLQFEYQQVLQTLKLEAEEKAAAIEADADAQINELRAETKFKIAELEGEAKKAMANAEKESNNFLVKKREFELRGKKLDVYESFAKNSSVVLSNSKDNDFNMLMLADNVLAKQDSQGGHQGVLAELNMLRLASNAYGLRKDVYIPDGGNALTNAFN